MSINSLGFLTLLACEGITEIRMISHNLVFANDQENNRPRVLILGGNSVYHNGNHHGEYRYTDTYDWQIIEAMKKLFLGQCDQLVLSGSFTKLIDDGKGGHVVKSEARGMLDRANELITFYSKTFKMSLTLDQVIEIMPSIASKIHLEEQALTSYENLKFSTLLFPNAQYYEMCSWGFKKPMFDISARSLNLIEDKTYFFKSGGENSLQDNISGAKEWIDRCYYQPFIDQDFDPECEEEKTRVMERDVLNMRHSLEERTEYLKAHGKKVKIPTPEAYPANQNISIVITL